MKPRSQAYRVEFDDGTFIIEDGETARSVHVEERSTWTGLYDADGNPIHREKEPFGFRVRD